MKLPSNHFIKDIFLQIYTKFINYVIIKKNEPDSMWLIADYKFIAQLAHTLDKNCHFKTLNDICVVDYPDKKNRFEVIYNLSSVRYCFRLFLKCYTTGYINSLTSIFKSAN